MGTVEGWKKFMNICVQPTTSPVWCHIPQANPNVSVFTRTRIVVHLHQKIWRQVCFSFIQSLWFPFPDNVNNSVMFSFHSGNENEISQKDRPRPIQRTLSMSSDKSVLGVKQWILRIVHCIRIRISWRALKVPVHEQLIHYRWRWKSLDILFIKFF